MFCKLLRRASAASCTAMSQPRVLRLCLTSPAASLSGTRRRFSSSPSFQHLALERKGHTQWISFDRPELHNAFNEEVISELFQAFRALDLNTTRSVVLTGKGKSFSAGADLNWMKKMKDYSKEGNLRDSHNLYDMVHAIRSCPLPVIARVNGAALGGGSGLVAACDFAFAAPNAKFGFTEVRLGLLPAVISRFVMDKIGHAHASRFFLTGEIFSAQEAVRIGLVQEACADEEALDAAVARACKAINGNSPAAVKLTKKLIDQIASLDVHTSREMVCDMIARTRVSDEGQEGLDAFLTKRKPKWLE